MRAQKNVFLTKKPQNTRKSNFLEFFPEIFISAVNRILPKNLRWPSMLAKRFISAKS